LIKQDIDVLPARATTGSFFCQTGRQFCVTTATNQPEFVYGAETTAKNNRNLVVNLPPATTGKPKLGLEGQLGLSVLAIGITILILHGRPGFPVLFLGRDSIATTDPADSTITFHHKRGLVLWTAPKIKCSHASVTAPSPATLRHMSTTPGALTLGSIKQKPNLISRKASSLPETRYGFQQIIQAI
jgi:hypothetical protein